MAYGFGRGGGFGRRGGGRGFGFRGASPPWPYVGIGRGGLPRHAYFTDYPDYPPPPPPYDPGYYGQDPAYTEAAPYPPRMTREEEIDYLKHQAEAAKAQLEEIEARMRSFENE